MVWEYSEKTKQLFMDAIHGKKGTHLGEIPDPDGMGEHGSIACGDALRFTFRVKKHPTDPTQDRIVDAKYLTFGCTSAIASSEALCAIIEHGNFTPIEALKIRNQDIVEFLGGLPDQKIHCSVMGAEALESAVFNWAQLRGVDLNQLGVDIHEDEKEEGRIVCKCFSLTEPYLKRKIKELGLKTIPEITGALKAGGACMSCHHKPGGLQDLLDEVWGRAGVASEATTSPSKSAFTILPSFNGPAPNSGPASGPVETAELPATGTQELSPYQFAKKVEKVFEEYIRPILVQDGGDVEIIDIKGTIVYCRFQGACAGCPSAIQTMKMMIEPHLKDMVNEHIRVVEV